MKQPGTHNVLAQFDNVADFDSPTVSTVRGDMSERNAGCVSLSRPLNDTSTFHHLVMQVSGTTLESYLDGTLVDTDLVGTPLTTSGAVAIGARNAQEDGSGGINLANAKIDEVWVYNRPPNPTDIASLRDDNSSPVAASDSASASARASSYDRASVEEARAIGTLSPSIIMTAAET